MSSLTQKMIDYSPGQKINFQLETTSPYYTLREKQREAKARTALFSHTLYLEQLELTRNHIFRELNGQTTFYQVQFSRALPHRLWLHLSRTASLAYCQFKVCMKMTLNDGMFCGGAQRLYLCLYFLLQKMIFSIVRIRQPPESKAPRHRGIGQILNLPSSSLIHFLERKQKVNTRSHISLDDLPPNCWKQWSKVNCLHLEPSVAEVLHSKLGALVHGLAGFGAASDTEKTLYYQFTCDSLRVLIFQNPQGVSVYLYNLQNTTGQTNFGKI